MEQFTDNQLSTIQNNIVKTMRNNPNYWGSSDYNLAIDLDDCTASIDHNTTCYKQCCANKNVAIISLYSFDTEGWFNYDEEEEEYTPIGSFDQWLDSDMFSFGEIKYWLNTQE